MKFQSKGDIHTDIHTHIYIYQIRKYTHTYVLSHHHICASMAMDIQTNVLWASDALNPWQVTRSICAGVLVFVDLLVTVQDRTWRMLEVQSGF